MINRIDKPALIKFLHNQFRLNWHGKHGIRHWSRVRYNGLLIARKNHASLHVVELFAFFHDSCRVNEYRDPGHGTRGAELASRLRDQLFEATDQEMILLTEACQKHSRGTLKADITVQTCFDADRLDLARVGIIPNPRFLCTDEAKHQAMLSAAIKRSTHRY
jgi:uncharacterized protein